MASRLVTASAACAATVTPGTARPAWSCTTTSIVPALATCASTGGADDHAVPVARTSAYVTYFNRFTVCLPIRPWPAHVEARSLVECVNARDVLRWCETDCRGD